MILFYNLVLKKTQEDLHLKYILNLKVGQW